MSTTLDFWRLSITSEVRIRYLQFDYRLLVYRQKKRRMSPPAVSLVPDEEA
jgi:hypothetical protein